MLDFRRRLTLGENKPPQDVQSHPKKKTEPLQHLRFLLVKCLCRKLQPQKGRSDDIGKPISVQNQSPYVPLATAALIEL